MRSRASIDEILRRIFETGGLTEDMERDVDALRSEYDEREGLLKKYGEFRDGEDGNTEYVELTSDELPAESRERPETESLDNFGMIHEQVDWQARYNELKTRYTDRFFGNDSGSSTVDIFPNADLAQPQEKSCGIDEVFIEREEK